MEDTLIGNYNTCSYNKNNDMTNKTDIPKEECCRVIEGPTPHGGVRMELYYFDKEGELCRFEDAITGRLIEIDNNGFTIFEVHCVFDHSE